MPKIFSFVIIISLIFQIAFSFYYSNDILNQNIQLDQYQTEIDQLKLDLNSIEKTSVDLTSINHISTSTSSASIPITQTLKINH